MTEPGKVLPNNLTYIRKLLYPNPNYGVPTRASVLLCVLAALAKVNWSKNGCLTQARSLIHSPFLGFFSFFFFKL